MCQTKSSRTSTTSVFSPTEHLPYKNSPHTKTDTHAHTHAHMHSVMKSREGEPEEKRRGEGDKQRKRGMTKDRESCILNIPSLIILSPRLSCSSWLAVRAAERERASDKDNKDSLLHTHCSFIAVYKVCHNQDSCSKDIRHK